MRKLCATSLQRAPQFAGMHAGEAEGQIATPFIPRSFEKDASISPYRQILMGRASPEALAVSEAISAASSCLPVFHRRILTCVNTSLSASWTFLMNEH